MYDEIRAEMNNIVELPDRHADLFIRLVRQNSGTLSKKKRELPEFAPLIDGEIKAMEAAIRLCLQRDPDSKQADG